MTDLAQQPLGDLAATHPGATRILDRAGLDYCCRGTRTLADACAALGLDAAAIAAEIEALATDGADDWTSLTLAGLADHLVATHHRDLRDELPLLDALANKVGRAHGARHPELGDVRTLVAAVRADLEPHLDKEERILFPAIRALAHDPRHELAFGSIANPIRVMVAEHDRAGDLLEHDTHVHIHKENHVLFPRALRSDEPAGAPQTKQITSR